MQEKVYIRRWAASSFFFFFRVLWISYVDIIKNLSLPVIGENQPLILERVTGHDAFAHWGGWLQALIKYHSVGNKIQPTCQTNGNLRNGKVFLS